MLQRKSRHGEGSTCGHPPKSRSVEGGLVGCCVLLELRVVREGLYLECLDRIRPGFFAEATKRDRHPEVDGWTVFGNSYLLPVTCSESLMICCLPVETLVHRLVRLGLGGGAGRRSLSQRQVHPDGLLPGRLVRLWHSGAVELLWRDIFQGPSVSWKCHIRQFRGRTQHTQALGDEASKPEAPLQIHNLCSTAVPTIFCHSNGALILSLSVYSAPRGHF